MRDSQRGIRTRWIHLTRSATDLYRCAHRRHPHLPIERFRAVGGGIRTDVLCRAARYSASSRHLSLLCTIWRQVFERPIRPIRQIRHLCYQAQLATTPLDALSARARSVDGSRYQWFGLLYNTQKPIVYMFYESVRPSHAMQIAVGRVLTGGGQFHWYNHCRLNRGHTTQMANRSLYM